MNTEQNRLVKELDVLVEKLCKSGVFAMAAVFEVEDLSPHIDASSAIIRQAIPAVNQGLMCYIEDIVISAFEGECAELEGSPTST
jgi:hypothetical protein